MIGELGVHAGEVDFGHVAGDALFGAHGASVGAAARGFSISWFRDVAGETFRIVVRSVFLKFLVRVVTGDAADTLIVRVVTAAIEHSIRLKPDVVNA